MVDLIQGLERYGMDVEVVDPWVDSAEAQLEHGLKVSPVIPANSKYGAVIAAVAHQQFVEIKSEQWRQMVATNGVLLDLKGIIPRELEPLRM